MVDIQIRGEIWDNDSSEVLRWLGWRDLTCPNDIAKALEAAGGDEVTVLVNSPGGDLFSGAEIHIDDGVVWSERCPVIIRPIQFITP